MKKGAKEGEKRMRGREKGCPFSLDRRAVHWKMQKKELRQNTLTLIPEKRKQNLDPCAPPRPLQVEGRAEELRRLRTEKSESLERWNEKMKVKVKGKIEYKNDN